MQKVPYILREGWLIVMLAVVGTVSAQWQARLSEREVSGTTVTSVVHKYRIGGDTADIWRDKRATMLCPSIPYNRYDFELKADTSFRKGDSYLLTFNTDFLYQSGSKDATVCVAVKYENHSIATHAGQHYQTSRK